LIEVELPQDLAAYAKQRIGRSHPAPIDQGMIDRFAELSGDRHWVHVDTERAAREMPEGKTIAHGLLLLSLAPTLKDDVYRIRRRGKGLNYGYDRVRFIRPVQVGDAVRLAVTVLAVERHRAGTRIEVLHELENDATGEVVLSAHNILLVADA
jgi:acyl dehydratase